jgi:hypothetical protein
MELSIDASAGIPKKRIDQAVKLADIMGFDKLRFAKAQIKIDEAGIFFDGEYHGKKPGDACHLEATISIKGSTRTCSFVIFDDVLGLIASTKTESPLRYDDDFVHLIRVARNIGALEMRRRWAILSGWEPLAAVLDHS